MFYPFDFRYHIVKPEQGGSIGEQFNSCFDQAVLLMKEIEVSGSVVRITCFFEGTFGSDFQRNLEIRYPASGQWPFRISPAFIAQAPTDGSKVQIALVSLNAIPFEKVRYSKEAGLEYIIIEGEGSKWLYLGGCQSTDHDKDTRTKSNSPFNQITQILDREGLGFKDLIRQWNYIGGILDQRMEAKGLTQNYQEFNEVRRHWYKNHSLDSDFPAATGIGANDQGINLEVIAGRVGKDYQLLSLKNPYQLDAHQYSENQLIGHGVKATPLFERGKIVYHKNQGHIWVSGTAAIRGEESVEGSVVDQTRITCENIDNLIQEDNLIRSGLQAAKYQTFPLYIRGYVKYGSDGPLVKEFIDKRYPGAISHILEADVCREELLVEIEAEYSIRQLGN